MSIWMPCATPRELEDRQRQPEERGDHGEVPEVDAPEAHRVASTARSRGADDGADGERGRRRHGDRESYESGRRTVAKLALDGRSGLVVRCQSSSPALPPVAGARARPGRKVASVAHRPLVRHGRIRYVRASPPRARSSSPVRRATPATRRRARRRSRRRPARGLRPRRRSRASASPTGSTPVPRRPPKRSTGCSIEVAPGVGAAAAWAWAAGADRAARARERRRARGRARPRLRRRCWSTAARRASRRRRAVVEVADVARRRAAGLLPRAATRGARAAARAHRGRRAARRAGPVAAARARSARCSTCRSSPGSRSKEAIARAVDAGVLPTRLPEPLARAATDVVRPGRRPRRSPR